MVTYNNRKTSSEKNDVMPRAGIEPTSLGFMSECDTTTLSRQPCWQQSHLNVLISGLNNLHLIKHSYIFVLQFYRRNRLRYAIKEDDPVKIEITYKHTLISYSREQSGTNVLKITFTAQEAGPYNIAVMIMGKNIRGSPFKKTFLPGM